MFIKNNRTRFNRLTLFSIIYFFNFIIMYKIILEIYDNISLSSIYKVYTYFDLEECRRQLPILKDRYTSLGATILELAIYKVEQINDSEQI